MKKTKFKKWETIFKEDHVGDRLYFIISGKVNVVVSVAGKGKPIATLGPGDIFGEIALFVDQTRNATVIAETPIKVWQILKIDFDHVLKNSTSLQEAFGRIVKERIHVIVSLIITNVIIIINFFSILD